MVHVLFTVISLFLATYLFLKLLKNKSPKTKDLPPVVKAWPLVGSLHALVKDPMKLIREEQKKLGSVFTIKVLGLHVTMLIGPEVSKHFFTAPDSEISQEEVYRFTIPIFGPSVFFGSPPEKRLQQLKFITNGLKQQKLRSYVGQMVAEAEDYFSKWGDCGTVDLNSELEHLITLTASRCLLGREVRESLDKDIIPLFRHLKDAALPISIFLPYLPISAHYRRDRAKAKLNGIFSKVIRSRKSSQRSEEDLLQTLLESTYKDGESNTDEQVTSLLIVALFVSQTTSAAVAAWTGLYLLQNKTHLSNASEEQTTLLHRHGHKIDFEILGEMEVLYRCIKEANRLKPPAVIIPRYCRKEFNVISKEGKEYKVPKGHIVCTCPAAANRLDYLYTDPDRFNPDRFFSCGNQPFSDISFGVGRHVCPGEGFAYTALKVIWSHILRNFDLELISSFPRGEWNGKDQVLARYKRRQISI